MEKLNVLINGELVTVEMTPAQVEQFTAAMVPCIDTKTHQPIWLNPAQVARVEHASS